LDAAERRCSHRHRDRSAQIHRVHAAHDTVGGAHGDRAHLIAADVLLHLGHDADRLGALARLLHFERIVQVGEVVRRELDVEHGADDLDDLPDV
jgi:hypothetical protein